MVGKEVVEFRHIERALSETLENMAFMEVHATSQDLHIVDEDNMLYSGIEVLAPLEGNIYIAMPLDTISEIARTVFGEAPPTEIDAKAGGDESEETQATADAEAKSHADSDNVDEVLNDVAGEVLNTFVGNLLKEIVPSEESFSIGFSHTQWASPVEDLRWRLFEVVGKVCGVATAFEREQ